MRGKANEGKAAAKGIENAPSLEEIAETTPSVPASTVSGSALGTCVEPTNTERRGLCKVRFTDSGGGAVEEWLPYVANVAVRNGDTVVLVTPAGAPGPVVMGTLAGDAPEQVVPLPSGHTIIVKEPSPEAQGLTVRLELPDGTTALEIDFQGEVPTVRLPEKDLSLDLEGRLTIAALSIDLIAKLGNVNVAANDDFKVTAERIWLN